MPVCLRLTTHLRASLGRKKGLLKTKQLWEISLVSSLITMSTLKLFLGAHASRHSATEALRSHVSACRLHPKPTGAESSALTLNYLEILPAVLHLFSPSVQTILFRSSSAAERWPALQALSRDVKHGRLLVIQTGWHREYLERWVCCLHVHSVSCTLPPLPLSSVSVIHRGALLPPSASHLTTAFETQTLLRGETAYFVLFCGDIFFF